ncbi:MAG: hypothetical protein HY075_13360 [Deltaproteobacteria bacterium]|nr:hypothetical protein [Deltaproteobacteria bacterium]
MILTVVLTATGCNTGGATAGSTNGGVSGGGAPGNGPAPGPGALAAISGTVTSSSSSSSSGLVRLANVYTGAALAVSSSALDANTCGSGTYAAAAVGGGGSALASGSFANGEFAIAAVPVTQELIVTFLCQDGATQRCLAKAGDQGLLCDAVADAVLAAFESALGKGITDPSFKNKPISKVASSIVEAAQNESTATDSFRLAIDTCAAAGGGNPMCYRAAINGSIFSGAFRLMQSMAQGWNVEGIFNLVADVMGYDIDIDNLIYSDFGTKLDASLSTDFVAQARAFVSHVVVSDGYAVKLECSMHYSKYHAGGRLKYPPAVVTSGGVTQPTCRNDAALALNGFTPAQIAAIYAVLDGGAYRQVKLGTVDCVSGGGGNWDQPGYFCVDPPSLAFVSKFKEANRNDPTGANRPTDDNQRSISLIEVFPELFVGMNEMLTGDFNIANACAVNVPDGPPDVAPSQLCQSWFSSWLASQRKNFAGLLGLYLYLKDASASGNGLFSLDDIHKIFANGGFLDSRLIAWGPGLGGRQLSNGYYVSPVLARDGAGFSVQDVFRWNFNLPAAQAEADALVNAALAASSISYDDTFKMFENIPTSQQIHDYVFGSSHHEEWNPFGSKYFYAAAVGSSNEPILCRMFTAASGLAVEKELDSTVRIDCAGSFAADDSIYPYVLQERGWMGDDRGRIYALADRKSGQTIRPGDNEVILEQIHPGNPAGECNSVDVANSVVTARLRYGWGNDAREDAVKAYCLNMSDFTVSNRLAFYWGGNLEISQSDGFGNSWKWQVGQVGRVDTAGANPTDIAPVCYFAPSGNLAFDPQTKFASSGGDGLTGGAVVEADGKLSSAGVGQWAAKLAPCSSSYSGMTRYYLVQLGSRSSGALRSDLRAYLIGGASGSEQLQFRSWGEGVSSWEDQFVYLEAATIEALLAGGEPNLVPRVAPAFPPTYTMNVKLLNQKHDAKFDPYCDDVGGPDGIPNGKCDCYVKGTTTFKDPNTCTLEDDAAEPTLSQLPYSPGQPNTVAFQALFARLGGQAGEDLHYVDDANTVEFTGSYLQSNQLWMNTDDVFQCALKAPGDAGYKKPLYVRWDGFWKGHEGCPTAGGQLTGGPIRLINPQPMRNAYDIERPNTVIKLANYATKTVGQGVRVGRTDKVFSFDEALALIALRYRMPPSGVAIRDGAQPAVGLYPVFESVDSGDNAKRDPVSAVLRALTRPEELAP